MAPSRSKPLESVLDTAIEDCDQDKVTIGAISLTGFMVPLNMIAG